MRRRPTTPAARPRPERFEFQGAYRGPFARLEWQGHGVVLAEWPGSLLAMLRAGVLGPEAMAEGERLRGAGK